MVVSENHHNILLLLLQKIASIIFHKIMIFAKKSAAQKQRHLQKLLQMPVSLPFPGGAAEEDQNGEDFQSACQHTQTEHELA